jgi:hypothetical protein
LVGFAASSHREKPVKFLFGGMKLGALGNVPAAYEPALVTFEIGNSTLVVLEDSRVRADDPTQKERPAMMNPRLWLLRLTVMFLWPHFLLGQAMSQAIFEGWREVPGNGTTATSDASVVFGGKLYLFGIGINDHGHYMNIFDGAQWSGWSAVPGGGTTLVSDAATVFKGKLYLFGIGINDHAHYMNVFDGARWSGWSAVPGGGTTLVSDAATLFNGKLYLFGIGINDRGHYMNVFDGARWSGWSEVPGGGTTLVSDAAAVYQDNLYLFGIGTGDQRHYVNSAGNGVSVGGLRYNEVYQKGTHNAYWVDVAAADFFASGTQERIIDQVLHEGVRSLELDLHFESGHSGEFTVYHTSQATSNSTCHYLTDCLDLLHRLDYLEPDHDVVTIVLEFKETVAGARVFGSNGVIGPAKQDHHIEDLDRQLWERLGSRLFTPGELLSNPQCQGLTLRRCVGKVGWPTLDQLRGRFIATVIGNWADNYWDWLDYANDDGGIALRAAFPLRSMLVSNIDKMECKGHAPIAERDRLRNRPWRPEIELNGDGMCSSGNHPYIFDKLDDATFQKRLQSARDASIFWQVEDRGFENLPDVNRHGIRTPFSG